MVMRQRVRYVRGGSPMVLVKRLELAFSTE